MIDFEKAINIAKEKAESLLPNARNFELEGIVLSGDKKSYEVSLSYDIHGKSLMDLGETRKDEPSNHLAQLASSNHLAQLAKLMSYRREHKVFFVDSKNAEFKGFAKPRDR